MNCACWMVLTSALAMSASVAAQESHNTLKFELLPAREAGVDFLHTDGSNGQHFITETVPGGLASFDFDLDGREDIYFVSAAELIGVSDATNRLYRNLGAWQFRDATESAGVGDSACGMGVTVADFDSDGFPDLFVSNFGKSILLANNGDGTFADTTHLAGLTKESFAAGASFFDADGDGDLDLYLANYVDFQIHENKTREIAGYKFAVGPNDYRPQTDCFYLSNADGTFTDASRGSGVAAEAAAGMGVLAADFDRDGDVDVFVCNDQMPNFLLLNDGHGNFIDDALLAGVAFDVAGKANGNMGVDIADFNQDGMFDLVTTTYQEEMPVLYESVQSGVFEDRTLRAGISRELFNHVSWGVITADFNLDDHVDVFLATGHFLPNLRHIDDRTDLKVKNYMFLNQGGGAFSDVSDQVLPNDIRSSRGAIAEDFDNDGDLDIVVLNANDSPSLLDNRLIHPSRISSNNQQRLWKVRLVGTQSNRDAIGATVQRIEGSKAKSHWVRTASRGYESSFGHVALVPILNNQAVRLRVVWPTGSVEEFQVTGHEAIVEGHGDSVDATTHN